LTVGGGGSGWTSKKKKKKKKKVKRLRENLKLGNQVRWKTIKQ